MTTAPVVLYVPNEPPGWCQTGMREAFEWLKSEGRIRDIAVYSLLGEVKRRGPIEPLKELLALAGRTQPDCVILQHVHGMGLTRAYMRELREIAGNPQIVYHEADAYGRGKEFPADAASVAATADVVFTVGSGSFLRNMKETGARDVRYIPHTFDQVKLPAAEAPLGDKRSACLIGNRVTARVPWRRMPGALERERLVAAMSRRLPKAEFAIYGRGWRGKNAHGPVSFDAQIDTLHKHRLSVNWDYFFDEPGYFSDRLPIALASGVPHVTTWHPDYDWLPGPEFGLLLGKSFEEIVGLAEDLLSLPDTELIKRGKRACTWVRDRLSHRCAAAALLQPLLGGDTPLTPFAWQRL